MLVKAEVEVEAQAQNDFLAMLLRRSPAVAGATALHPASVQAYRGNLAAGALRALSARFPTALRLLEAADFEALALQYLAAHPPQAGDWARYGAALPAWLQATNPGGVHSALPFLSDVCALDNAVFTCENAADCTLDASSLQLLAGDAAQLRVVLQAGVAVVRSEFVIVDAFHGAEGAQIQPPQAALVRRVGWRAQVDAAPLDASECVSQCAAGATVIEAVTAAQAINADFDFAAWLHWALQLNLISSISTISTISTITATESTSP